LSEIEAHDIRLRMLSCRNHQHEAAPSAGKNEQGPTAALAFPAFLALWFL